MGLLSKPKIAEKNPNNSGSGHAHDKKQNLIGWSDTIGEASCKYLSLFDADGTLVDVLHESGERPS